MIANRMVVPEMLLRLRDQVRDAISCFEAGRVMFPNDYNALPPDVLMEIGDFEIRKRKDYGKKVLDRFGDS